MPIFPWSILKRRGVLQSLSVLRLASVRTHSTIFIIACLISTESFSQASMSVASSWYFPISCAKYGAKSFLLFFIDVVLSSSCDFTEADWKSVCRWFNSLDPNRVWNYWMVFQSSRRHKMHRTGCVSRFLNVTSVVLGYYPGILADPLDIPQYAPKSSRPWCAAKSCTFPSPMGYRNCPNKTALWSLWFNACQ